MHAELAYLFRHALMRDAAYDLQLPGDRAKLHELAFELIEQAFGGRAPEPAPLESLDEPRHTPHPTDVVAIEHADHARQAIDARHLHAPLRLYLHRAAEHAQRSYNNRAAVQCWLQLAELLPEPLAKAEAL